MPPALKTIDEDWLWCQLSPPQRITPEKLFDRLPYIEKLTCKDTELSCFPAGLKSLNYHIPNFVAPLPKSLTSLQIDRPLPSTYFATLPATLRVLCVGYVQLNDKNLNLQFQPWNADDVAQLVSKVQLEELQIIMKCIDDSPSLASLSNMKSLKKIAIHRIALEDMESSPQWLPQCLPSDLKYLHLDYRTNFDSLFARDDPIEKISDDFLRLCDLASVTPHLKTLFLTCRDRLTVEFGGSFASLPRELIQLEFFFERAELLPEAASLLPRSLKRLNLTLGTQSEHIISNSHFERLPETLQDFSFEVGSKHSVDEKLLEILPNSIIALSGDVKNRFPQFNDFIEKYLSDKMLLY